MKDAEFNRLVVSATELFLTVYQNSSEYIDNSAEPLIMERNGRSPEYSYWTDLAKSIYTEELYENALEHGSAYDCVLGLMINHEGKAYFLKNTPLSFGTYYEDDEYIFYFFKETIKTHLPIYYLSRSAWSKFSETSENTAEGIYELIEQSSVARSDFHRYTDETLRWTEYILRL